MDAVGLNQGNLQQQAGISLLKMAMGVTADQGELITEMLGDLSRAMELTVRPYLGANIDIRV